MEIRTKGATIVACIVLAMACGEEEDDRKAKNPRDVVSRFSNPSGTVSDGDADSVVNQALQSASSSARASETRSLFNQNSSGLTAMKRALHEDDNDFDGEDDSGFDTDDFDNDSALLDCFSEDDVDGEVFTFVDMGCFAEEAGCTSGGGTIQSFESSGTFVVEFENASLDCENIDDEIPVLRDCQGGLFESVEDGLAIACIDMDCTIDGERYVAEGCVGDDISTAEDESLVSVEIDDGSVLCLDLVPNEDCSEVCTEWEENDDVKMTITCDVSETSSRSCDSDGSTILEVENCKVDREVERCGTSRKAVPTHDDDGHDDEEEDHKDDSHDADEEDDDNSFFSLTQEG